MSTPLGFIDRIKAAIISLFKGPAPKGAAPPSHPRRDETEFICTPGTDGFVNARIQKKMRGNIFEWRRIGIQPEAGCRFEIRPKLAGGRSPLHPTNPAGVDVFSADVNWDVAKDGERYQYSLWQVLADRRERELEDPEIEIVQF
jgi:hypothetical protein